MRSHVSLRQWTGQLLHGASPCAQHAAWELLRALLLGFQVNLSQLARQLDRHGSAKVARQRLARWLDHPAWEPPVLYARLLRLSQRVFAGRVCHFVDE